jgi:hypothetical protein
MTRPFPTLVDGGISRRLHRNSNRTPRIPSCRRRETSASPHVGRRSKRRRRGRAFRFLSRNSNPIPQPRCGVAQLILKRKPASLRGSGLRRTVEASRPEGANPPAGSSGFPCSLQHRRLSAISLRGSLPVRSTVSGRFRARNLVNLAAQSKCFFGCPQCCNVGASWRGPQQQGAGDARQIVPRW